MGGKTSGDTSTQKNTFLGNKLPENLIFVSKENHICSTIYAKPICTNQSDYITLFGKIRFSGNLLPKNVFFHVDVSPPSAYCCQVSKYHSITNAHASSSELQFLSNSLESDRKSAIAF